MRAAIALFAAIAASASAEPALTGVRAANRAAELIAAGNPGEARRVLEAARGTMPAGEEWAWWGYLGMAADELRDLPAARAAYRESARLKPDSWFATAAACHRFWEGSSGEAAKLLPARPDAQDADLARRLRLALRGPFEGAEGRATLSAAGRWRLVSDLGGEEGPARRREIAALLDRFAVEVLGRLGFEASRWPEGHVATVFIVRDTEAFAAFARDWSGGAPRANQDGFYDPNVRALLMTTRGVDALDPDAVDTLFHEAWHQVFDLLSRERPAWLNEGLAEYCGKARAAADGSLVWGGTGDDGTRVTRAERFREHLAAGTALPLQEFARLGDADWSALDPALAYAQSWAVVQVALQGEDADLRAALCGLIQDLAAGKPWADAARHRLRAPELERWETRLRAEFGK